MQDTYDPFSYLLSEIRAHDAGLRGDWDDLQRHHYLEVLLIEEAQEIAWGRRHITVIHGEPVDDIEAELLDELFAAWEVIGESGVWSRIGGVPDQHLTLALGGPDVEARLAQALECAAQSNPGHWKLLESAVVQ